MDLDALSNSYDLEAGFSGGGGGGGFSFPSSYSSNNNSRRRRRPSYRDLLGSPSPRTTRSRTPPVAGFFYDSLSDEESHHFLDSCFLCKRHLAGDSDIFMYRGDTPFCSEECRQQQIEMDEQKEKKGKRDQKQRSGTTKSRQTIHVGAAGTVVG